MIRMEYPRVSLEGLTADEKVYALQKQVDMLTHNLQIVLDSISDDLDSLKGEVKNEIAEQNI